MIFKKVRKTMKDYEVKNVYPMKNGNKKTTLIESVKKIFENKKSSEKTRKVTKDTGIICYKIEDEVDSGTQNIMLFNSDIVTNVVRDDYAPKGDFVIVQCEAFQMDLNLDFHDAIHIEYVCGDNGVPIFADRFFKYNPKELGTLLDGTWDEITFGEFEALRELRMDV